MILPGKNSKPFIDLRGSQGNALYIMGVAKNILKDLKRAGITTYADGDSFKELPSEANMMKEFMSSNYQNLINTFDKYFGEYCDLHT